MDRLPSASTAVGPSPLHSPTAPPEDGSFSVERLERQLDDMERAIADAARGPIQESRSSTALKKLIIQIPCLNEEATLGVTLAALPRSVDGVDVVEWMIIDDGSSDKTIEVAQRLGVDHIVRLPCHQGLARAFSAGIEAAVRQGADIIVNTDADNQYNAADIPALIAPIVEGRAEYVVGARPIGDTEHFSTTKKRLQRLGSWVVRKVSRTDIPDAPSGFRAISREAAMQLNVFGDYTYTLETIIQAGQKSMAITWVPVRTNRDLRPSRLLRSIPGYVFRSALTIFRIFATYRPFPFFAVPGTILALLGATCLFRYLMLYFTAGGAGHIQSVILGSLLVTLGMIAVVVGLITDLISVNRKLLEKLNYRVFEVCDLLREHRVPSEPVSDRLREPDGA